MKKIFLLFAMAGTFAFTGCTVDDEPEVIENDYIFEAEVFQVNNVDFNDVSDNSVIIPLDPSILESDMVLVYRRTGMDGNDPVWELIPSTYHVAEGQVDFNFDFSVNSVVVYLDATFDPIITPEFSQDQVFRVVIIPGYLSAGARMDFRDYKSVVERFNIEEANIRTINK